MSVPLEERRSAAERAVKRGDFREAVATYETLVLEHPDDPKLSARLAALREHLQPMELSNARAGRAATSDAELGEEAANAGDVQGALAAYRRAAAAQPGNALVRERLEELEILARAAPSPASAARSPEPRRSGRTEATAGPAVPAGGPSDLRLPADPVHALQVLLERVRARPRIVHLGR